MKVCVFIHLCKNTGSISAYFRSEKSGICVTTNESCIFKCVTLVTHFFVLQGGKTNEKLYEKISVCFDDCGDVFDYGTSAGICWS